MTPASALYGCVYVQLFASNWAFNCLLAPLFVPVTVSVYLPPRRLVGYACL